jgi:hypothetical protein
VAGVSILGEIPRGLLGFENPLSGLDSGTQLTLFASAITLALVGYMEVRSAIVQWWGQGHRGSRRLEEACGPGWLGTVSTRHLWCFLHAQCVGGSSTSTGNGALYTLCEPESLRSSRHCELFVGPHCMEASQD